MSWRSNPNASTARSLNAAGEIAAFRDQRGAAMAGWSDEVLMSAVVARDEAAFAVLYDRYVDLVYSAALRVLGDTQLAEDTTQDIFVRLWRRPETFVAARGRFLSWLMSVSRNRAVDMLRARGRRQRREGGLASESDDDQLAALPGEEADPVSAAQLHEEQSLVRAALLGLPKDQRLALELAYFGGLTQQEIAVMLHEPLGTVKTRIRLGMQKLRRSLNGRL
jgi:RNA polymerase sigma-70 factor (ECF subfamily)